MGLHHGPKRCFWRKPCLALGPLSYEGPSERKGHCQDNLENFDAAFFGISPKKAEQMDPHQRLGLEVTWAALENAGLNPKALAERWTPHKLDHSKLNVLLLPRYLPGSYDNTNTNILALRISYHLDIMGASVAVDSACAPSLRAVHFGHQAVLGGESRIAVVGGVKVCSSPDLFHMLGSAAALSPDGVYQSFDDDSHGYARGEGAAVFILKHLSHAVADGDQVLATLEGTDIAQDGKTNGIKSPNAKAQELIARKALAVADEDPLTVLTTLLISAYLVFASGSKFWDAVIAVAHVAVLAVVRDHVGGFWKGKAKIPAPKLGEYNEAISMTQEVRSNMAYLAASRVVAGVLALIFLELWGGMWCRGIL
ncbi:Cluster 41 polyketide synthase [Lachnellula subtilissima]|uniref:Cluster 41 polyketide synthase n=1 Tax=Lachnellula subtilissima TaxID=602034 RepID=A0A8H8RV81_9HELO|nr:Cluster 41 polyketide synthase [Lachnellula subtilissima]